MKTSKRRSLTSATKPITEPKLSRIHAPADLSPVEWQRGLRRQFGREQAFGLENLTSEPFFSEFRVSNPASKSSYRVAIRGKGPGGNFWAMSRAVLKFSRQASLSEQATRPWRSVQDRGVDGGENPRIDGAVAAEAA